MRTIKRLVPVVMLVALAACTDTLGPGDAELQSDPFAPETTQEDEAQVRDGDALNQG